MPKSKNKRVKRYMKPRTFLTQKSARRYLNRFRTQLFMHHRDNKRIRKTCLTALKMLKA